MKAVDLIDVTKYRLHNKDNGSVELQIYMFSAKIYRLTQHLESNRQDKSAQHGMMNLISKRKRFLKYVKRTKPDQYEKIIKDIKNIEVVEEEVGA